jgi:hypothetical protein
VNIPHWAEKLLDVEAAVLGIFAAIFLPLLFGFFLWESCKLYRRSRR